MDKAVKNELIEKYTILCNESQKKVIEAKEKLRVIEARNYFSTGTIDLKHKIDKELVITFVYIRVITDLQSA